jgi:exonuclease III
MVVDVSTYRYVPEEDADKVAFLAELRLLRSSRPSPWALCGDFNLIYRDEDKNHANLNRRMMGRLGLDNS